MTTPLWSPKGKIATIMVFFLMLLLSLQNLSAHANVEEPLSPSVEYVIVPNGAGFTRTQTANWVTPTNYCPAPTYPVLNMRTRWVGQSGDYDWAKWTPNLPAAGNYRVEVYLPNAPGSTTNSTMVRYQTFHAGGSNMVVVNQAQNQCSWVVLGTYYFNAGSSGYVYMGDFTGDNPYRIISASAVRFVEIPVVNDSTPPIVQITAPTNGSTISTPSIGVLANASDSGGSGLQKVEFLASYNNQSIAIGTDTTAPFEITWNVPANVGSGQIMLSVRAFDNAGNPSANTSYSYAYVNYQKPTQSCEVPYFSQIDPRWKNHPLRTGGAGTCSSYCNTIGKCGCTLTSTAMLFAFYGHNTNPQQLSDCMWGRACPFVWGFAGSNCSGGKAQIARVSGFSWATLSNEINTNHKPVLVGGITRRNTTHWVLVTSGSGNQAQNYTIHDPGVLNGRNVKLSDALVSFTAIRTYHGGSLCSADLEGISNIPATPMATKLPADNGELLNLAEQWSIEATSVVTAEVLPYRNESEISIVLIDIPTEASEITEMLVWSDDQPQGAWQPFYPFVELPLSSEVFVRLREANGDITDIIPMTTTPTNGPISWYGTWLPLIVR